MKTEYLFDIEPYSRRPRRAGGRPSATTPAVRDALARLKQSWEAVPPDEKARRQARYQELERDRGLAGEWGGQRPRRRRERAA
jgi:hypothetical protein